VGVEALSATSATSTEGLSVEDRKRMLRLMLLSRALDERGMTLQRQGRIGFYVPVEGQEGAQVGCAWALDAKDWLCPGYRETAVALTRGVPLPLLLGQLYGDRADLSLGRQMPNHFAFREYRYVSASSPIGTQIPHAVGLALAARLKGEKVVAVAFFGDGATSSNDFHSGLNFAGVFRAPVIFFCQNNQWAISLPRSKQTRSETLAQKAEAYGFPGVQVDGNDVKAVYTAVKEARARALAGGGPTLIEAVTYRMGPHTTSDDPRRYRSPEELALWKSRDPVERLKDALVREHALSEEEFDRLLEGARAEVATAIQQVEPLPPPDPMTLFDDTLSRRTPQLEEQRQAFLEESEASGRKE
jgi:pyruvate dehydrogenase E1 component alpha subunit